MKDMTDWRDKDDLDLTSEDLGAMIDAGEPVELVSAPRLPGHGAIVVPVRTHGGTPAQLAAPAFAQSSMRVSQQLVS